MKKLMIIAFVIVSQMLSAQATRDIGDFNTIRVFDRINVTLVAAGENKIEIKGSRADDVEVVTKNNELKIRMKLTKLLQGESIDAIVYYKKISTVEASEGSYVASQDTFKGSSFSINSKEGANVKLALDVDKLATKINSGGEIELSGKAGYHDASITAGGNLKAKGLSTSETDITISAGGEADITASKKVDAKTKAGGTIDIYGNPKTVNKKTTLGGSIELRE